LRKTKKLSKNKNCLLPPLPPAARDVMDADAALRAATSAFLEYDCGQKGHLLRYELRAAHVALFGWNMSSLELDSLLP
jgi:hypothetical protein